MTLETWKYGCIQIVDASAITEFDTFLGEDVLGEWEYYYRPTHWGDIVAVHIWDWDE